MDQLDSCYRECGWTARQVIQHCAESHMNCYIRIKWTLTENKPVIKQYDENLWSELNDSITMAIEPTLSLHEGLHFRLAYIMNSLSEKDLEKKFIHPENGNEFPLKEIISTYALHGNHHLANITELKKRNDR